MINSIKNRNPIKYKQKPNDPIISTNSQKSACIDRCRVITGGLDCSCTIISCISECPTTKSVFQFQNVPQNEKLTVLDIFIKCCEFLFHAKNETKKTLNM